MRNPEELENYFMSSNRGEGNSLSFKDFFAEIQKDAYNQAIQDVEVNIECCMNLSEGFEYPTVKWDSISKLKIK